MTDMIAAEAISKILLENGYDAPIIGETDQYQKIYFALKDLFEKLGALK